MSSYKVVKRVKENGKWINRYLSTTGQWIKSSAGASVYDYEIALQVAEKHLAGVQIVRWRD